MKMKRLCVDQLCKSYIAINDSDCKWYIVNAVCPMGRFDNDRLVTETVEQARAFKNSSIFKVPVWPYNDNRKVLR